jgi:DNA-directed RNA polymerase subunit H (RpoH/RPB5)
MSEEKVIDKYIHPDIDDYIPTGYVQFDIYQIVLHTFLKYRGMTAISEELEIDVFMKNMQFTSYVNIEATKGDKKYIISILDKKEKDTNEFAMMNDRFKLYIHNMAKGKNIEIYIISPCPFQTHILKYIAKQGMNEYLSIFSYDNFKDVKPLAPGASSHYILDNEDAEHVVKYFNIQRKKMKTIFTNDPQVIWLGATPNQIILIKRLNQISGYGTDYRRVVQSPILNES